MAYQDIKEIAKQVRIELKKEFPDCKFSVRIDRFSMGKEMKHITTKDKNEMPKPRTDIERDLQNAIVGGIFKNTVYCQTCDKYHGEVK